MAIISAIIVLGGIGAIGAVTLNRIAKKFYVYEDPRVGQIEEALPGANCGACGMKGCHDFAVQCVKRGTLDGLYCPGAGKEGMAKVAQLMGCDATDKAPNVAVIKCAGTADTKTAYSARYQGPRSCAVMNTVSGEYLCTESCLGCGDCVKACRFDSLHINPDTGLPEVDTDKCTGCGVCATACPRNIIELRPRGLRDRRVWVACSNCQKGPLTRKQCKVGCIACGLCIKACPFGAIEIVNSHAYIHPDKCKTCGKCVSVCPTKAIHTANMIIPKKNEPTTNV